MSVSASHMVRALSLESLRKKSSSDHPEWQTRITRDHGNVYSLQTNNTEYLATELLKASTETLSDVETALANAGYTLSMDESNPGTVTHCMKVDASPVTANLVSWGNSLKEVGFQKSGGVEGYINYCSKMAVFMTLCTLPHLADMIRNVAQAKKMAASGGFTPMKPFLMALMQHVSDLSTDGNFLRTTAEIIHRMAFFHKPSSGVDNSIYTSMLAAYELRYDHPDKTIAAVHKLKNMSEVYDALPDDAKSLTEGLESASTRLFGLRTFSPEEERDLTAMRRLNAVASNTNDLDKKDKQFKSLTGRYDQAAKIAYEGTSSGAINQFNF